MDNMRKDKNEKDVSVLAEAMLKSYADSWAEAYADEAEELLRDDEQYRKAVAKCEKHKRRNVKKRMLRCAAIIICAVFLVSVVIPIPQAHAWRVWWLDLVTGQNNEDSDVRADDEYIGEYYVSELPEGFEIEKEECSNSRKIVSYKNKDNKTITFTQIPNSRGNGHIDKENTDYETKMIGDFEVLIGESDERIVFEMVTENTFIVISTDSDFGVGEKIIENLRKIS